MGDIHIIGSVCGCRGDRRMVGNGFRRYDRSGRCASCELTTLGGVTVGATVTIVEGRLVVTGSAKRNIVDDQCQLARDSSLLAGAKEADDCIASGSRYVPPSRLGSINAASERTIRLAVGAGQQQTH
jgi:hypothetical protein